MPTISTEPHYASHQEIDEEEAIRLALLRSMLTAKKEAAQKRKDKLRA